MVDEIEDITDVERDGLNPGDREGIDQALLTVIPRVIKQEEVRQEFPQLNFLLLCSQAVGGNLQGIKAIERRTGWHELTSNSFADVEAFFQYLRVHRPKIYEGMAGYPAGLKEAAFFAANRNFGWFNVIMNHAHANHRGGQLGVPELLRKFATESPRGHKGSVFDLDQIGENWIVHDGDYALVERLLFGLLPPPIGGSAGEVTATDAERLLRKTHKGNDDKPLFTRLVEIKPPARHLITAHLVSCGFKNPEGNWLQLPGESRFDIQVVLDSLQAYSIALPPERRQHLLLPEKLEEFTEQVRALSPYADEAERFAPYLHGLLVLPEFRQRNATSEEHTYLAPAFSFLQRFHRLNKLRRAEVGYLRDSAKNSQLVEACQQLTDPQRQHQTQLRGLAFAWEQKLVPCESLDDFRLPALRATTTEDPRNPARNPLNVAADHRVTWLWVGGADEAELTLDLQRLAREPLHPIVTVLQGSEEQLTDLRVRIARVAPAVIPCLILHALSSHEVDLLLAYGLLGRSFAEEDLKTRYFAGGVEMARQRLDQSAKFWRQQIEDEGLILRPIFPGRAAKEDELQAMARGYIAMLGGASYDALLLTPAGVFADATERDLFRKAVERHVDPGPKYREHPTLGLFAEQSGEKVVQVPRPLLTLMERCGGIARARGDIERQFFFALPSDTRAADAVRQATSFLRYLGLLEVEGAEKYRRTVVTSLVAACERGLAWLDGNFDRAAHDIRAVHQEPGDALLNKHAKQARHDLVDARKRLQGFSLDFVSDKWSKLEKIGSDNLPIYVSRFQLALAVVAYVRATADCVFEPDAAEAFQYAPEGLEDFESQSLQSGYPLWRRVGVLHGFYQDLARRRQSLLKTIDQQIDGSDQRVPASSMGEKLFPTQVLALPLGFYRQELQFAADSPQRTVTGWGSTLGTTSLGFKLHSGKYHEALERLEEIERQITLPGGFVHRYLRALAEWESLASSAIQLAQQVDSLFEFFADAPAPIKKLFDLPSVRQQAEELAHVATGGGMRENTDNREAARTPALQLIDGLEDDMVNVKALPANLLAKIADVENSVLVKLTEDYNEQHKARHECLCSHSRGSKTASRDDLADHPGRDLPQDSCVVRCRGSPRGS